MPTNDELSLLDYLKAKLKFWEHREGVEIPEEPEVVTKKASRLKPGAVLPAAQPAEAKQTPRRRPSVESAEPPSEKGEPEEEWEPAEGPHGRWPVLSLLSLAMALIGQHFFEPSMQLVEMAYAFYAVSIALLIWAIVRKEWALAAFPEPQAGNENFKVRRLPFYLSVVLAVATFIFCKGNLYTPLNVTLWALTVICFFWAFWLPGPGARPDKASATESGPDVNGNLLANDRPGKARIKVTSARQGNRRIRIGTPFATSQGGSLSINVDGEYVYTPPARNLVPPGGIKEIVRYTITNARGATSSSTLTIDVSDSDQVTETRSTWERFKEFVSRKSWQLKITPWTLLILAVAGLVIFFRVYRINTVPIEPFSDHAEKLLDVYDVTQGQTHIFFPRNTGREDFQMYLTVAVAWLFGTGLTFLSLKLDTVICGLLTLPYMYVLGKEVGGKRIGLLAVFFAGIAYWPNVISRVGLRFTIYPLFAAPTLYYLIRGLRTHNRNDFILSGLFLGMGLHGYTSFRIVPFVVVAAIGIYLLHAQSKGNRQNAVVWLMIITLISLYVFLPLARYWQENPEMFGFRALSRLGTAGQPLPGPWWQILLSNTWNSLRMFNWDNGGIWVHSVPGRPAFDVVSAALFLLGVILIFVRYLRERHWLDLFLLVSIPLLQLPSTLSLAFPAENPSLNRPSGAFIPAFLIVAIAMDGLFRAIEARRSRIAGTVLVWSVALILAGWSISNNYDLVFNQYANEFRQSAWNTSEIADVIRQFGQAYGTVDHAYVVPYPYWVDTRLVGDWLGKPAKDFALWPQDFNTTQTISGAKLFIVKPDDTADVDLLKQMYPQGVLSTFHSAVVNAGKDFYIFFVPPAD
ncbi:MAG TPA: glycosyltransferase family 39 protein [Anaerolineales bacterium]|nr:glycosyltransferase family 39 protein [Anaerolineales bacterium]